MNRLLALLTLVLLVGCSLEGKVDGPYKWMDCTDLRDGERFSFHTSKIRDVRVDLLNGTGRFTVTDSTGQTRALSGAMESFIKCVERK